MVSKDDPDNTYASIKADDFFFPNVTYYYDEGSKPPRVTQILFHVKKDLDSDAFSKAPAGSVNTVLEEDSRAYVGALKTQLTERYGSGKEGKRGSTWKVRGLLLTLEEKGLLLISKP
jgi:hypothetical protein